MKLDHLVIALAICMTLPSLAYAELYKWKDKNGQTQYTDTPPPSNIRLESISGKKHIKPTGQEPLTAVVNQEPVPVSTSPAPQVPTASTEDAAAKIRQENAEREKQNKQKSGSPKTYS